MPVAIACPKCKSKYNLQESLIGKAVKCKSCGTVFKVTAPSSQSLVPAQQSKVANTNVAEYARMGLSGPIESSAGLFDDAPVPSKGDPLGNHVVHDPGFGNVVLTNKQEEKTSLETDYSELKANPAIGKPKEKKRKKDPLREYLSEAELNPNRNADGTEGGNEYGGAAVILYIIGAATILYCAIDFFMMRSWLAQFEAVLGPDSFSEKQTQLNLVFGLAMGMGALFIALGVLVNYIPITALSLGLIFYTGFAVFDMMNPVGNENWYRGLISRIVVFVGLAIGLMIAINQRLYERKNKGH